MDVGSEPATVEIAELGELSVIVDGVPTVVVGTKARMVLALLSLKAGSTVTVDHLLDVATPWPAGDRSAVVVEHHPPPASTAWTGGDRHASPNVPIGLARRLASK